MTEEWSTEKILYKAGFKLFSAFIFFGYLANTLSYFIQYSLDEKKVVGGFFYFLLIIISIPLVLMYKDRRIVDNKIWFFPKFYKQLFIAFSLLGYILIIPLGFIAFFALATLVAIGGGIF